MPETQEELKGMGPLFNLLDRAMEQRSEKIRQITHRAAARILEAAERDDYDGLFEAMVEFAGEAFAEGVVVGVKVACAGRGENPA